MSIKDIMAINAKNIKQRQYEALLGHAIQRLKDVEKYLQAGDYEAVASLTKFSPAGDGMGTDHSFIDFRWDGGDDYEGEIDIADVCRLLKDLQP